MLRKLPIGLLLLVLGGCATGDGMTSKLQDASRDYNRYLRWGDQDRAAAFLPGEEARRAFYEARSELADRLHLVEYEVTRLSLDKQRAVATSHVAISWHTDRDLVVRRTEVEQTWQWYEGKWVLVDERRVGGVPLAGFAEPGGPHPYLPGLAAYRRTHGIGEKNRRKTAREKQHARAHTRPPARGSAR